MRNRIELKRALDALQDIAGDASDLIPALEAAEKVFDWVLMESQIAVKPGKWEGVAIAKRRADRMRYVQRMQEAMREAFSEAYDREAEWTGRV